MGFTAVDYIFISICIIGLMWGYAAGLNRCFKFFTTGIFGVAIAVVAAWFIGVALLEVEFFSKLVSESNEAILKSASFLGKIKFGSIIYFIIIYIISLIIKNIIVRLIVRLFNSKNKTMKFINKAFGALFLAALFGGAVIGVIYFFGRNQDSGALAGIIGALRNSSIFKGFFMNPPFNS